MFLYKNNFSSFENIWGARAPPGPMGMTPLSYISELHKKF